MNTEANTQKTKKEIEEVSERITKSKLKFSDIIIPLCVAVILIILAIFVFVPMIKSAIDFRYEYSDTLKQEEQLTKLEASLNGIDDTQLQTDLINARKVIPKTLKVSSFMYYIDNLARQEGLSSKDISAGDIQINNSDEEENVSDYILGVSGPLSYAGNMSDILSFLESLYSASPYIISVENIRLEQAADGWKVSLNVTGYYVPEGSFDVDVYSAFTPYTKYADIVTIFETKASQLD